LLLNIQVQNYEVSYLNERFFSKLIVERIIDKTKPIFFSVNDDDLSLKSDLGKKSPTF
jgi:hypothetical protein